MRTKELMDASLNRKLGRAALAALLALAAWQAAASEPAKDRKSAGIVVDPGSIFDCQVKRIHVFSEHFCRCEPGAFEPIHEALLTHGDRFMHLADLGSYLAADRDLVALYADPDAWARKALLNVAASGKFSSDRTVAEYAAKIWGVSACPVSP